MRFLTERPVNLFDNLQNGCFWFEIRDGECVYAYGALEPVENVLGVHLRVLKFNHSAMRVMEKDWGKILAFAKTIGCKILIASNEDVHDKRWPKFISHFGFPLPKAVLVSQQEVN